VTGQERDFVVGHLLENRERLLRTVAGLAPEQQLFRAEENTWSVADCVEHVTLVEDFILSRVRSALEAPPRPEKRPQVAEKLDLMLPRVPSRETKVKGPEWVQPKRQWGDFSELVEGFNAARDRSVQFASQTNAELCDHFFPHPNLADLDCYQWLVFIALHCERHVRQMEEVMAHPGFPAARAAEA
jgi:uncharacterized damage-inducible protein DinB